MTLTETAAAILLLLATPGPTNTLLALAGAERGWRGALPLIPFELGAYLAATLPLAVVGARLLESLPVLRIALTFAAAAWVLWLSVAMWRPPGPGAPAAQTVDAGRITTTTLLNPKGLVFGLVLLPASEPERLVANIALFAALIVAVAASWAALGAALTAARPGTVPGLPAAWRRAAALWLGGLAAWLAIGAAGLAA
jgi:threonine/homoserine/homoserine lactone efflux protein